MNNEIRPDTGSNKIYHAHRGRPKEISNEIPQPVPPPPPKPPAPKLPSPSAEQSDEPVTKEAVENILENLEEEVTCSENITGDSNALKNFAKKSLSHNIYTDIYKEKSLSKRAGISPQEEEKYRKLGDIIKKGLDAAAIESARNIDKTGAISNVEITTPVGYTYTDKNDRHIPSLDEVFDLARKYPGKKIILDCKTSKPEIAERMAKQLTELFKRYPDMKDRVILMSPEKSCLDAMRKYMPPDFNNYWLDNMNLNSGDSISSDKKNPLYNSDGCDYIAIAKPVDPRACYDFNDVVEQVREARRKIDNDPSYKNKKLYVWTLNSKDEIKRVIEAGADGVLTDNSDMANQAMEEYKREHGGKLPRGNFEIIAHRGGSNSKETPENTLPRMEMGFQKSDAIEIDISSCKDGLIAWHDGEPGGVTGIGRNLGLETDNDWRPTYPDLFTKYRGKDISELTIAEVRANYGYSLKKNQWLNILAKGLVDSLIITVDGVIKVGKDIWNGIKSIGTGIWDGVKNILKGNIFQGIKSIGEGLWNGVKSAGKSIVDGVKSVTKAVGTAVKAAGNAVANVAKKAWEGVKSIFKGW
ncbi:MAG: glycerophosphodiester phosphodiesterase family protein [Candidatus Eremiobacterota bacterium]